MTSPRTGAPRYLRHRKPDGDLAYVYVRNADGKRSQVYLGLYDSPSSQRRYSEVLRCLADGLPLSSLSVRSPAPSGATISILVSRFLKHAEGYYRKPSGRPTLAYHNFKLAAEPLLALYRDEDVASFGPLKLQMVRERMRKAKRKGMEDLSRRTINDRVQCLKRIFKWGVAQELVSVAVHEALRTVDGLRRGQARDNPPVRPVSWPDVEPVLPHLHRHVGAIVMLTWLSGMRVNELVQLTAGDIDRSQAPWIYVPAEHKTEHHGKQREIYLGPEARRLIAPFLKADPSAPIFSPRDAVAELRAARRAVRKSKIQPSQRRRGKKATPIAAQFGKRYTADSLRQAIHRACERAGVEPWGLLRLRHSFATRLRAVHGIEVTQTALGHSSPDVTLVYAEADRKAAQEAVERFG